MMLKKSLPLLVFLLFNTHVAYAEDNSDKDLKEKQDNQQKTIEAIQDQNDINQANIEKLDSDIDNLNKIISFKPFGSLALRNCFMADNIFSEPQNIGKNIRGNLFQTRIVAGITGNVVDDFSYQLRLFSGEANSYNISWLPFRTDYVRFPLVFDRYFISYEPHIFNKNFRFTVGKSPDFFAETELLFDEDISFSGLSQQFNFKKLTSWLDNIFIGLSENFFAAEGPFNTSYVIGAKAAGDFNLSEKFKLRVGGSYVSVPGSQIFSKREINQGYLGVLSKKNRLDSNGNYLSTFNMLDGFVKLDYKFSEKYPVQFYADIVNNLGANDKNKGYLFGASIGDLRNTGDLFFNYNFKSLEQDYNLSFLVQDQMGGTDVAGNQFDFGVQVASKTKIFFNLQQRFSLTNPQSPNLYILYSNIRQDF